MAGSGFGNLITEMYKTNYNRAPSQNELSSWGGAMSKDPMQVQELQTRMAKSPEYIGQQPSQSPQFGLAPLPPGQQMPAVFQTQAQPAQTPAQAPAQPAQSQVFDLPTLTPEAAPTSTSQSGVNWESDFMKNLAPILQGQISGLPGLTQALPGNIQDAYSNLMRQALGPEAFQGTLNQLANRNILQGTPAENIMSQTATDIAQSIGNKGFEALAQGYGKQMQVPGILSSIAAQLGPESTAEQKNLLAVYQAMFPYLYG